MEKLLKDIELLDKKLDEIGVMSPFKEEILKEFIKARAGKL